MWESARASFPNAQLRGKSIEVEREFSSEKGRVEHFRIAILVLGHENCCDACSSSNKQTLRFGRQSFCASKGSTRAARADGWLRFNIGADIRCCRSHSRHT